MSSEQQQKELRTFRITFRRFATALLTVQGETEDDAFDEVDSSLDDDGFNDHYGLEIDHRYWIFDEPVDAHRIITGPDEDALIPFDLQTWVVQIERVGHAYFRVKATDQEAAIRAAEDLMTKNEIRHPIESEFWSLEPEFELIDAEEISPSDWDSLA
jgi:hypothetical protein